MTQWRYLRQMWHLELDKERLDNELKGLGEQGWEMVNIVPIHNGFFWAFFKRPVYVGELG